jgi:hypothetical protein
LTPRFTIWIRWLLALLGLWSGCAFAADSGRPVGEYQAKAVFLFNFTRFIEWPEAAFSTASSPIVIGIVGEDPFKGALEEAIRGETVRGRPLALKHFSADDSLAGCHILFLSRSIREHLDATLRKVSGLPILTVADTSGWCERGAMINLPLIQGSVKMEIRLAAARRGGLNISSKLLNLAKIIPGERETGAGQP